MNTPLLRILLFLFAINSPRVSAQFIQTGNDIIGSSANDKAGWSLDLSGDGGYLVVGIPVYSENGIDAGAVKVFQLIDNEWIQTGSTLFGKQSGEWFGHSVSLSSDGLTLAVGAPFNNENGSESGVVEVFRLHDGEWTQIGESIYGDESFSRLGWKTCLSHDGSILAISAPFQNLTQDETGKVRIYKLIDDSWIQLGDDINGEKNGDHFGLSISLSNDGNFIAIGAPMHNGNAFRSGLVRVYHFETGTWQQYGNDIIGDFNSDYLGWSVSLSANGSMLAVGIPKFDVNNGNEGAVIVYSFSNGKWFKVGSPIFGEHKDEQIGLTLELSADGSSIVLGNPYKSNNTSDNGNVEIYQLHNNNWSKLENSISGTNEGDLFGWSVAITENLTSIAIGAPGYDENEENIGLARTFSITPTGTKTIYARLQPNIIAFPNPASNTVTVLLEALGQKSGTLVISDQLGRTVLIQKLQAGQEVLDLDLAKNGMNTGVYQVTVTTETQRLVKRLMVNR